MLGIVVLLIALTLSLQLKPVQNYIADRAANYLSEELDTEIHLRSIYYEPFNSIKIEELFVADQEQDTLLYFGEFGAQLDIRSLLSSKLIVNDLTIKEGKVLIKKYRDSTTNFTFIQDYLAPQRADTQKEKKQFELILPDASFSGIEFRYINYLKRQEVDGINYNDIHIYGLGGTLLEIDYVNHLFQTKISDLTFREKSGLVVKNITTDLTVDSNRMEFAALDLELNSSYIKDYILFEYDSLSAFSNFIEDVQVTGNLQNSRIVSRDIAYFSPGVSVTDFNVLFSGNLTGTVEDIHASQVQIRAGKQTWLEGDLTIRGLPDINNTLFDMDLSRLLTNRQDLERLVAGFSGQNTFMLPAVIDRIGDIHYQGRVTGFYNDFITQGIFKSKLGDVVADLKLSLKNKGSYSGKLLTPGFELGLLLNNPTIGSVAGTIEGSGLGFALADLYEEVNASIDYLEYQGYRYTDILVDGTYSDRYFTGNVDIDDTNLRLSLVGEVDVSNGQLIADIHADVDKADLYRLKLTKDSLELAGVVSGNFSGKELNTVIGQLSLRDVSLITPDTVFRTDSVVLIAEGLEDNRTIAIQSDVLDARINGQIDLNTFPSYFKGIAKQYVPSLDVNIINGGNQEFSFDLTLKDFTPFSLLFVSGLEIPEEVIMTGKFSSVDGVSSLSGFVPVGIYKGVTINNLIFDQTANNQFLNLFVTSDRVSFTDSLFINNVNIANILRNDSLRFNIKMSDLDETNQLDLNGLVEFGEESSSRLSLLPSDMIINNEDWRIEEKVKFDFEEGKTLINGLELSQGEQIVAIDGAISKNDDDILKITFSDFLLETFNPLTVPLGIDLAGMMNGEVQIRSLLEQPFIQSDIRADDIVYNETAIGDMTVGAALDPETRVVRVKVDIQDGGVESLTLNGVYDASNEESPLNLQAHMDENPLIIFSPFLRNLVSDLSGTATADLTITGTSLNPVINGTARLNNSRMVVNYLQTPYRIDDEISVSNSKILLKDLIIVDENNQQAVANGSVDMSNPINPEIHVDISANNFMALNTTAKDNPLYYGVAYGTGSFRFNGPTDDIDIQIVAATNRGTVINIPLNAAGEITEQDFITFVNADSTATPKPNSFEGLTMTMDLSVDPESEVNIFTDLGKLSGRGEGLLSLHITSLGDFEMFGDYAIQQGKFEFTAQDFINKIFEIESGGSIRWTGNPEEALINLTATYQVRTSVRPLYTAAGRAGTDQRVQAQAEMILNGNLLQPDITFGIDFPTDSYVEDELQSYLSDINNVNQQALSLIVRRSFAPGTGTDLTRELNTTVFSAGTELAFNQLNNIISQSLNLNFVDFNIRSFNEASASIRLLNDRLILTGGVTDRRGELNDFNVFGKDIASDVEALYLIRKSGNLLFRASNRLNNRNFLNPEDEYVSAFGLVYRQEFDTFGEFFRKLVSFSKKKPAEDTSFIEFKTDTTAASKDTINVDLN